MGGEDADDDDASAVFSPVPSTNTNRDTPASVVIIGGGPGGLAAAIYAARAGLKPTVVSPVFGGQLLGKGVDVENYPGVVGAAATGKDLVQIMRRQVASFEATMVDAMVTDMITTTSPFQIQLNITSADATQAEQVTVYAHSVIVATGADSRWLGVPGEHEYRGNGVSSCATCDGFLYRDLHVLVVGGGDTAMEDALVLARTSSKVTVVHRRGSFRASHMLASRVLNHPKIEVKWNTVVGRFSGDAEGRVTKAHLVTTAPGGAGGATTDTQLDIGAAFVAIGHDPNTAMFKGKLDMSAGGYLAVQGRSTRTSVEGVFACGDVADPVYRQAVTSAGLGAMAALDAERWLSERGMGA